MAYAYVVRSTKDHEIASHAVQAFEGHMAERADGLEGEGVWLVCYRTEKPKSVANQAAKAFRESEHGKADLPEAYLECQEIDNQAEAMSYLQELLSGEVFFDLRPMCPTVIPVHTLSVAVSAELMSYIEARKKGGNE